MGRSSPCRYPWLPCFGADRETWYTTVVDEYDLITGYYKGWTLTEIRELAVRERREWINRALKHVEDRAASLRREE